MQIRVTFVILAMTFVGYGTAVRGGSRPETSTNICSYRFEVGDRHFEDLVRRTTGAMALGKVVEWADGVRVYRPGGLFTVVPVDDIEWVELRRQSRHSDRPELPDLTISYVERLPRDPSGKNGASALPERQSLVGRESTWRVHVQNSGKTPSTEATCIAAVDGTTLGSAKVIPALSPGESHVVEFSYTPKAEDSHIMFEVDPDETGPDALRWNNRQIEKFGALAITVVVERSIFDAMSRSMNLADSFGAADYIRFHFECFNALLAGSRHPLAPDGVLERVRCDRILVEASPNIDALRKSLVSSDGLADYDGLIVIDNVVGLRPGDDKFEESLLRVDWRFIQQLGHAIGLIDLGVLTTTISQCDVFDRFERPALVKHGSDESSTLMLTAGPYPLTEVEAVYLNRVCGRPRGVNGSFLQQVPENVIVEVVGNDGLPLPGVQIDLFQLQPTENGVSRLSGLGGTDPILSTVSDESGRAQIPNRPNAEGRTLDGYDMRPSVFGAIEQDGSNGLLLFRLRHSSREEFSFLSILDCNRAFLHGDEKEFLHRIATRFASADAPPAIRYAVSNMADRSSDQPELELAWPLPAGIAEQDIAEYRIYRRLGFGGSAESPWSLVETISRTPTGPPANRKVLPYFEESSVSAGDSLDTHFAVTVVNRAGQESALSEPAYLAHDKIGHKLAIRGLVAYMTLSGGDLPRMLYWDPVAGTQAYAPRTDRIPDYQPHYEGIAFDNGGRLIVTDPVNHVLAVYDTSEGRHELVETIPARKTWPGVPSFLNGGFCSPADVAADAAGRLYVADRGNHRVQILDAAGKYVDIVDSDFRFRAPEAVAVSFNKYLTVTDNGGKRVRVYELGDGAPTFVRQLPTVWDADRAMLSEDGQKIFVTGRRFEDSDWAVLVYEPDDDRAKFVESLDKGVMGQYFSPRGLFQHDTEKKRAYFMNSFPFDVRLVQLEQ